MQQIIFDIIEMSCSNSSANVILWDERISNQRRTKVNGSSHDKVIWKIFSLISVLSIMIFMKTLIEVKKWNVLKIKYMGCMVLLESWLLTPFRLLKWNIFQHIQYYTIYFNILHMNESSPFRIVNSFNFYFLLFYYKAFST